MKVRDKKKKWLTDLVNRLESKLISYANQFVKNIEVAKEIVQETFIKLLNADYEQLLENAPQKEGDGQPENDNSKDGNKNKFGGTRKNSEKPIDSWLYRVCRNLCIDHLRRGQTQERKKEDVKSLFQLKSENIEEKLVKDQEIDRIKKALSELDDTEREIMNLKFKQELSYKEISEITGQTVNYVGVKIHNIIKKMQTLKQEM